MPKAKTKKGDQNTTVNVINDINEIIGDMNQTASQDEEELIKLEKIAGEIDEAEQAVSNIPQPVSPIDDAVQSLQLIKDLKKHTHKFPRGVSHKTPPCKTPQKKVCQSFLALHMKHL